MAMWIISYDGITAMTTLYKYCLNFTDNVSWMINQRSDGHKITDLIKNNIDKNSDVDLVIAVDSSSNDTETAEYLNSLNIDFLIIDHHHISKPNPLALIVNPQQTNCNYVNKNISGGLLTYKVCEITDAYLKTNYAEQLKVMAGLSVAADAMNMLEPENRYYYSYSLNNIIEHYGLWQLFLAMKGEIHGLSGTDFAYLVSPCITSATRLDQIEVAVELMMNIEENPIVKDLVKQLIELNNKRKKEQVEIELEIYETSKFLYVIDSYIGKGYQGLIASDLVKNYRKPAIVIAKKDGFLRGSMRSPNSIPFLTILKSCNSIEFAEGHEQAAGISIPIENFKNFIEELDEKLSHYEIDDSLYYILELNEDKIDEGLIKKINEFYRYTGNNFENGKFLIKDCKVEKIDLIGKEKNTLKIITEHLTIMKFKVNENLLTEIQKGDIIDVVGTLNVNSWKNPRTQKVTKTCQIFMEDFDVIKYY